MSDYEPPAEAVAAMEDTIRTEFDSAPGRIDDSWTHLASFVLRRQHERECGLLEALENISRYGDAYLPCPTTALLALERWEKLDAPKVPEAPTLLEAAKAMAATLAEGHWTDPSAGIIAKHALALKAAVEREEKREKRYTLNQEVASER